MLEMNQQEYIPLREVVFNTIRDAIIKGDLKPGERLLEIQLAEKLGVSRTPIREAIRKLENEGLVIMVPRKGATVSGISVKHLKDVLEIRGALGELAVRLACDRMTKEQMKELKRLAAELEANKDSDDAFALSDIDEKLHEQIYLATNNPKLIQLIENLKEQMFRYRLEYMKAKDKRDKLIHEHQLIIDAIEKGDAEEGEKAIREHIASQEKEILKTLGK
ncbi:MAG: GntR family transcriptional regulator [Lachnospiraceae bacterium]|nr:GntR family transcriptional regulator [Lachnospiraceae bacterium]